MNPIDEKWLAEVETREAKATEGPWLFDPLNCGRSMSGGYGLLDSNERSLGVTCELKNITDVEYPAIETAEFIVNARTDIPRLLKLVREMAGEAIDSKNCIVAKQTRIEDLQTNIKKNYSSHPEQENSMNEERMMKWFNFSHLPDHLKAVSSFFYDAACQVVATVDPGPERTVALRKLLEAKDAAVRAKLNPGG